MNINHFCDPDPNKNHFPGFMPAIDTHGKGNMHKRQHPNHNACRGFAVIDFGLKTEQILRCDCPCHPFWEKEFDRISSAL